MKTKCETCSHQNVCSNKRNYEELIRSIEDLARLIENKPFHIEAICRFYSYERGNDRG